MMIENVLKQYKDNIALSDAKGTSLTYETLDQKSAELFDTIGGRTLVFSFCRNEAGSVSYCSCSIKCRDRNRVKAAVDRNI